MRSIHAMLVPTCIVGVLLGAGCAGHDRDPLVQPIEPNYANPADPLERQVEDPRTLDARGRTEAPVLTLPEADEQPPEDPDPDGVNQE